jgi:hypothetical protein
MVIKTRKESFVSVTTDENADPISVEELTEAIKYSKKKKQRTAEYDGINIKLM